MSAREQEARREAGLDQVRDLEDRLKDASGARAAAQARVARARDRAERTLAEARERAEITAGRRREAALAEADHQGRQRRRQTVEEAETLIAALDANHEAISAFVDLVLPNRLPWTGRR